MVAVVVFAIVVVLCIRMMSVINTFSQDRLITTGGTACMPAYRGVIKRREMEGFTDPSRIYNFIFFCCKSYL